jgi:hypothetical protein
MQTPVHSLSLVLCLSTCLPLLAQVAPGTPANAVSPKTGLPIGPTTGSARGKWFLNSTVGPVSLLGAGPISAAWGTMINSPEEYGPGWEGFGKRYGMRLSGIAVGNAIEASFGAIWDEDPRYYAAPTRKFGSRVGHVFKLTFMARRSDGSLMPAYARYIATTGNNIISNAWREPSENDLSSALYRAGVGGMLGRLGGNAFAEFWPDVRRKIFKK